MPNWCYNKITIRANDKTRNEIKEFLKGKVYCRPFTRMVDEVAPLESADTIFSFHSVIPQPDHLLDEDDPRRLTKTPKVESGNDVMPDWYNWRVQHWGTKWDVTDVYLRETKVSMSYEFETAWSPAEPVVRRLSEKFPNAYITLTYNEPGMGFKGSISFKDGEVMRETEYA